MTAMRRWIYRSLCLVLLLLCLGGWVASYTFTPVVAYQTKHQFLNGYIDSGSLFIQWNTTTIEETGKLGVDFQIHLESEETDETLNQFSHALGFHGGTVIFRSSVGRWRIRLIGIPFWFLTLLASAITFWVWRKTRPKPNPSTAFPVEITGTTKPE